MSQKTNEVIKAMFLPAPQSCNGNRLKSFKPLYNFLMRSSPLPIGVSAAGYMENKGQDSIEGN